MINIGTKIDIFEPLECTLYSNNQELFELLIEGGAVITDTIRTHAKYHRNKFYITYINGLDDFDVKPAICDE
jgi:hypothetical protein